MDEVYMILAYLKEKRAIDFSAYKPGTVRRRIDLRMARTGSADYCAYYNYLTEQHTEADLLLSTMTINVSKFFRDPPIFKLLKEQVLPRLMETRKNTGIRIWCAGCAGGEEVYSLAILLKELLSGKGDSFPVFLIATDIDPDALAYAKRATYRSEELTGVDRDYLDRYFIRENGDYRLCEEIRAMVTFARHDLTTGRPPREGIFSDYNLILCRNTLIYFNRDLYARVVAYLSDLLTKKCFLVLGEAETLPACFNDNFREIAHRSRIFMKETT
jgi:two-component system, chemotaxis family, CheB/CheR fusion protein